MFVSEIENSKALLTKALDKAKSDFSDTTRLLQTTASNNKNKGLLTVNDIEEAVQTFIDVFDKQNKEKNNLYYSDILDNIAANFEKISPNIHAQYSEEYGGIINFLYDIADGSKDVDEGIKQIYSDYMSLSDPVIVATNALSEFKKINDQINNIANNNNGTNSVNQSTKSNEIEFREKNEIAISEENKELIKQNELIITLNDSLTELEKKAQTMGWKDFALDESLTQLKSQAQLHTLADVEDFWTKSNYKKDIKYFQMSEHDADNFIKTNVPTELFDWYEAQDFDTKTQLEKLVLSNNELRNAAINKMFYVFKEFAGKEIDFYEFLDKELEVFRGDESFAIFDNMQSLSFSYLESHARKFSDHVTSTKIKPTETIGNLSTPRFNHEAELFVPSDKLPYKYDTKISFKEFYNSLGEKVQKILDDELIYLEKNRIKGLFEDSVTRRADNIKSKYNQYFSKDILEKFKMGNVPERIENIDGGIPSLETNEFINMYNNLSSIEKKLIAFYTTLPDTESISENWTAIPKLGGQNGITPVMFKDRTGYNEHINKLTNKSSFINAGTVSGLSEAPQEFKITQTL